MPVRDGPGGRDHVDIDTTWLVPPKASASSPVGAVVLEHGLGGDKHTLEPLSLDLAQHGYEVVLWSARGHGATAGPLTFADSAYDVQDLRALLDELARRSEVGQDGRGDPRVGLVGTSYGGALALLTAAADRRVDAVVAMDTWHSLVRSLAPQGVAKRTWGQWLLDQAVRADPAAGSRPCGALVADVCRAFADVAAGSLSAADTSVLERVSPSSTLRDVHAPTLLVQGQQDPLFDVNEAVETYRTLGRADRDVSLIWASGGHGQGSASADVSLVDARLRAWLDRWLHQDRSISLGPAFSWYRFDRGADGTWPSYPAGAPQPLVPTVDGRLADPASAPASGSRRLAGSDRVELTGPRLSSAIEVVGVPEIRLQLSGGRAPAVFAELQDVGPDGRAAPVRSLVTPVRDGTTELSGVAWRFAAGHRVRLVLSASAGEYAPVAGPVTVGLGGGARLVLPVLPTRKGTAGPIAIIVGPLLGIALLVLATRVVRRRTDRGPAA